MTATETKTAPTTTEANQAKVEPAGQATTQDGKTSATETQQAEGKDQTETATGDAGKTGATTTKVETETKTEDNLPVEFDGLDPEANQGFAAVAKELNLKPEAAKTLGKIAPILEARQARQIQDAMKKWDELAASDKEYGGPKMRENLADAYRLLEDPRFTTPELRKLLDPPEKGGHDLWRNPEVKRLFHRMAKAIGPDKIVTAGRGGGNAERSPGAVLFPGMTQKA